MVDSPGAVYMVDDVVDAVVVGWVTLLGAVQTLTDDERANTHMAGSWAKKLSFRNINQYAFLT